MKKRLKEFILEQNLIEQGDIVCVGLSGGADSVCLFLLLYELREELGFSLQAFHVNHHLRGEESEKDRAFAEKLCAQKNIYIQLFDHDVAKIAAEMKKGTEETGRILRKKDAEECIKNGCTKIALAHHKNDQAETFLFNAARGSSIDGLSGIKPESGYVIHPLLPFSKEEILNELKKRGRIWRTDRSNADLHYSRNRIRQELIPILEEVNPQAVSHIYEVTEDLTQIKRILDRTVCALFEETVTCRSEEIQILEKLKESDPYLITAVIKKAIETAAGRKRDISRSNLNDVALLFRKETGKAVDLPFELTAERTYTGLVIKKRAVSEKTCEEILFQPEMEIRLLNCTVRSEFIEDASSFISEKNKYTKCFDCDKISRNCVFRTRKSGDRLVINARGDTKKLKDYLINTKVPKEKRDKLIVFADGNLVHWVVGMRMGESAKISKDTKRILKIEVSGGYTDELSDP